jgi:hypothetical protein
VIEDLAMVHPRLAHDRPAVTGHVGRIASHRTIPVSTGLSTVQQVHHCATSTTNSTKPVSIHRESASGVEPVQKSLARAVSLGLLDVSIAPSGAVRVACPHASAPQHCFDNTPFHITQKYVASIGHQVCSLYCTAPQTASAVLQQFSDVIWQCLIQMGSRRSIDCLYDLFPLLHVLYHTSAIESLLLKALATARVAGPAWYAKVCHSGSWSLVLRESIRDLCCCVKCQLERNYNLRTDLQVLVCCARLQNYLGDEQGLLYWKELQAAVEAAFPHPSYISITLQSFLPLAWFAQGVLTPFSCLLSFISSTVALHERKF